MALGTKTGSKDFKDAKNVKDVKKKEAPQKATAKPAAEPTAKKAPEAPKTVTAPQAAKTVTVKAAPAKTAPMKTAAAKPAVKPVEKKAFEAPKAAAPVKAIEKKAPSPVVHVKAAPAPVKSAPIKAEVPAPVKKQQPVGKSAAPAVKSAIKEPAKKSAAAELPKGFIKDYLPGKKKCKVTFRLPRPAAADARIVTIVGDFNNWDNDATPMKKTSDGDFVATIELAAGKEYRFRYLINAERWENDWNADRYEPAPYGQSDNSVVVV
jgi:hypothetical protein